MARTERIRLRGGLTAYFPSEQGRRGDTRGPSRSKRAADHAGILAALGYYRT